MDDDVGFDDDGLLTGTASAVGNTTCDVCGSSNCLVTDTGETVCLECGAQSQDVRNLEQEELDGAGGMRTGRGGIMFRRAHVRQRVVKPAAADAFTTTGFLRAMQRVLAAQTRALISQCRAPEQLWGVVGDVWGRYIARWAHERAPLVTVVNGNMVCGLHVAYYAKLRGDRLPPPTNVPPSLPLTLAVQYVACRWLSLPVLPHDIAAWARNGTLAYVNAYGTVLTPQERVALVAARSFFTPTRPPSTSHLARLSKALAYSVGVTIPRLNTTACIARLVNVARLPSLVLPIAFQLATLIDVDTVSRGASEDLLTRSPSSSSSNLLSKKKRERTAPDELSRRRATGGLDLNSAAEVAAIVYTALRLLDGWEAWVDVHLAPECVGDIATSRFRIGCTAGLWGAFLPRVRLGAGSGCCEDIEHHNLEDGDGASLPPMSPVTLQRQTQKQEQRLADVPFPATHDQVACAPAALIPHWVSWAGRALLTGGDMVLGRGADMYTGDAAYRRGLPGAPGASVRVVVPEVEAGDALDSFAQEAEAAARGEVSEGIHGRRTDESALGIDDALVALLGGVSNGPRAASRAQSSALVSGGVEVEVSMKGRTRSGNVSRRSRAWGAARLTGVAEHSREMLKWAATSDDVDVGCNGSNNSIREDRGVNITHIDDEDYSGAARARLLGGCNNNQQMTSGGAATPMYARHSAVHGSVSGRIVETGVKARLPNDASPLHAQQLRKRATAVVVDPARSAGVAASSIVLLPCERQAAMLGRPQAPRPPLLRTRESAVLRMLSAITDTAVSVIAAHAEDVELLLQYYTPLGISDPRSQPGAAGQR